MIRGLAKPRDERWATAREYYDALEAAIGPVSEPGARLARSLREVFPAEAQLMDQLISFYREGGDAAATAFPEVPTVDVKPPVDLTPPVLLPPPAPPEPSTTMPAVAIVPVSRARQIAIGALLVGLGWLAGWLLLPQF